MIIYQVLYSMFCLLAAGIAKAFLDNSAENRFKNKWLNKGDAFSNKWQLDEQGQHIEYTGKRLWYHLWLFTPQYVERFPLSSTICVFVTDGWHVFQAIMLFFICLVPAAPVLPHFWPAVAVSICAGLVMKGYFVIARRFVLKTKV